MSNTDSRTKKRSVHVILVPFVVVVVVEASEGVVVVVAVVVVVVVVVVAVVLAASSSASSPSSPSSPSSLPQVLDRGHTRDDTNGVKRGMWNEGCEDANLRSCTPHRRCEETLELENELSSEKTVHPVRRGLHTIMGGAQATRPGSAFNHSKTGS